jgi:hypothetical protein
MQGPRASLPDALAECLEAMASHPRALEECLRRYQHYRRELEPLLHLAAAIRGAVQEVAPPSPYLYLVPGGRAALVRQRERQPLLVEIWQRLDGALRLAARQHPLAVRSALLSAFLLLALSGWVLVMGSAAVLAALVPHLQPLWLVVMLGVLPWVFLLVAVRSSQRWLLLLAYSPPLPGPRAAALRRGRLGLLSALRDLWDSPAVGVRLVYRLSVWTLVRVVGLALVLGWALPLLSVGAHR